MNSKHIKHNIHKYPDKNWNWSSISSNPNITIDTLELELYFKKTQYNYVNIEKNPTKPWDWYNISSNI